MAWLRAVYIWVVVVGLAAPLWAQSEAPSEVLLITGDVASTWTQDKVNIVQIQGPVTIDMDGTHLTSGRAVIWLTPVPGASTLQQRAEIVLLDKATLTRGDVKRQGDQLFVTGLIRGTIRITAEERLARNASSTDLFKSADAVRTAQAKPAGPGQLPPDNTGVSVIPPTRPTIPVAPVAPVQPGQPPVAPADNGSTVQTVEPVNFSAGQADTVKSPQDKVAVVLSKGVVLYQRRANGDFIELRSDRAVLYTQLNSIDEIQHSEKFKSVEDAVEAAYLEGDVRIVYTPALGTMSEQRLNAERVYYEFGTDRAVLTDAVIHTIEPLRQIPVIVRANTIRQLSLGEYNAENVKLSTSSFATPSYAVAADKAYIRQADTGDPRLGNRTTFIGNGVKFDAMGVPVFYLPYAAGSVTDRGGALRDIQFQNNNRYGFGVLTEWGLFETLGRLPPEDLDITYRLDYYTDRGFATGLNAGYGGGHVTEATREPWNFEGDLKSYFVFDHGEDEFGGARSIVEPDEDVRGRIRFEHQHFFPDDWQVQLRASWVSDPTFLEQWFKRDYERDLEHDVMLYVKRQRDSEALTLLVKIQPNDMVTTSDLVQEQFEVERLPEIGYYRVGDALIDDRATFFSSNTVSRLRFNRSEATLQEQGFPATLSPGLPSLGQTGIDEGQHMRGDFRQELDYPFTAGSFKVVPYVMGRYTGYSDSPDEDPKHRLYAGMGLKLSTAFWRVDDSVESELFDLHRLRHVIEPQVHLYTSAQTEDRNDVFIYDEQIDDVNDISAVQLALRQRWQTKRGGPGRWRSVDFFSLNVEANLFANQPDDDALRPANFRGLFFNTLPEASIPRNSINADATWRISDTTAFLGDVQFNLDKSELATISVGLAVQRDVNLSYFIGMRYIEELNSNITTFAATYRLTPKYTLSVGQRFDFGEGQNVSSNATITRKFDRFFVATSIYYDATNDISGFNVSIQPEGFRPVDSATVQTVFPTQATP